MTTHPYPVRPGYTPTTTPIAPSPSDPGLGLTATVLSALIPEWQLALRAENKALGTIDVYTDGIRGYLRWCEDTDDEHSSRAPLARTTLQTRMATSSTPARRPAP